MRNKGGRDRSNRCLFSSYLAAILEFSISFSAHSSLLELVLLTWQSPKMTANKKRKELLSPRSETNVYHMPPCFSLVTTFNILNIIANAVCWPAGGTPPSSTTVVARPPSTSPASVSTSLPSTPEPRRSPPRYDKK
jgi:hypothetical protein